MTTKYRPRSAIRLRERKRRKPPSPVLRKFLISLIFSFLTIIGGLLLYDFMSRDLPSLTQLENFEPNLVTRIFSADSVLIHEFYAQRRVLVPLDEIPEDLVDAFIAVEDIRFRKHWGISTRGILRAIVVDLMTLSYAEGASTITQQLATVLYFNLEKRLTRKIKEAITAVQIERTYAKDEILEMYLNSIYLGHGAYGVQAASKRFFDKKVQDITIAEAALLAAVNNGPSVYSPINYPDRAVRRRNLVLSLMRRQGFITSVEYDTAYAETLAVQKSMDKPGYAPYFTEYVRKQANREAEKLGVDILRDGLTIYTTLDTRIQAAAEEAARKHIVGVRAEGDTTTPDYALGQQGVLNLRLLEDHDELVELVDTTRFPLVQVDSMLRGELPMAKELREQLIVQMAVVAVDPSNGHILALVGGRDFALDKWNRAVQMERQPGSVFKPFVWTTVIDNGVLVTEQLLNQPVVVFLDDTTRWSPGNYDRSTGGLTDLRTALMKSLNLISVRIVQELTTPGAVREYAQEMGITSPIRAVDAIALGTSEVKPIEMVSAFGTFPNGGVWVKPTAFKKIIDRFGNVIKEYAPMKREVLSEETAYIMTDLLESTMKNGTGISSRTKYKFYMDAGGKTGTTQNYTDAWFVGFTPKIAAVVWVGMDQPRVSLGEGQAGATAALPIWSMFMKTVYDSLGWEDQPFVRPEGIVELEICEITKDLPTPYCPLTTEIFNKKYVPTKTCSIHTGRTEKKKSGAVTY